MTAVNKDHHCRSCHQTPLLSTMTAFALPLPSPSDTFAISIAAALALATDAIAKSKDKSKNVNDFYHRALRKPPFSKCVIFWQRGFLKVGYC
jgi:hypothetical protein